MDIRYLRIPLYTLYYVRDIESVSKLAIEQDAKSLKNDQPESNYAGLVEAVKWATKNPDYDYGSLLPNLKFSNESIYTYLCKWSDAFNKLDMN